MNFDYRVKKIPPFHSYSAIIFNKPSNEESTTNKMGICPITKTFRVVQKEGSLDPFVNFRSELILKLRKLHNLHVKCKKIIESLIFDNKRDLALQIKAKQFQLKVFSSILHISIEKLDNFGEITKNSLQKSQFLQNIIIEINEKERILNLEQIDLIFDTEIAAKDLKSLSGFLKVDPKDLEKELTNELKVESEKLEKLNKGSYYQR